MKRLCVVTGATGHIGNVVVRQLLERGDHVRVLVLPNDNLTSLFGLDVDLFYGDVRDPSSLAVAFAGADCIYHLAGIIDISRGQYKLMYAVNVEGTMNVVRTVQQNPGQRLAYVSSVHAIPFHNKIDFIREVDQIDVSKVKGSYGKTKAIATRFVFDEIRGGLNAVVLFPSGVIGPYEFKVSNVGQLLIEFVNRKIVAKVRGAYNFVDVRDVAAGIIKASLSNKKEGYILGGERIDVTTLFQILEEETGVRSPKLFIPMWLVKSTSIFSEYYYRIRRIPPLFTAYSLYTLTSNSYISSAKAKKDFDFQARSIRESIHDMVDWLRNKRMIHIKSSETNLI